MMDAIFSQYVLGNTDAEHQRLIRQAERLNPFTEQLFRDAGICHGQRILDVGSGVGEVAMLVAGIVGPSGEVVGVERDPRSLAKAKSRVAEAGLQNVSFLQSDIREIKTEHLFDGVVGRFILEFLPDPASALRSFARLLRPEGVVVFHEPTWSPLLQLTTHLPLWSATLSRIRAAFQKCGAITEMEVVLFRSFGEAGLPAPRMWMEMPMGNDPFFAEWVSDLLLSVRPQMDEHNIDYKELGDLGTLRERLEAELETTQLPGACVGLVGAWCNVPGNAISAIPDSVAND